MKGSDRDNRKEDMSNTSGGMDMVMRNQKELIELKKLTKNEKYFDGIRLDTAVERISECEKCQ